MNHLLFILITQIFTFLGVNGLTFLSKSILDLESNMDYFQTEASYWTSTNTLSPSVATSQCDGTWLLGGNGVFGPITTFSRAYSSLPSHTQVYFSIYIWYIDLNQQTDLFDIYVDNTNIKSINSDSYSSFNPPANRCGGITKDFAGSRVDGKFSHSAGTLTFKLVSRSNSAFSIGFRQLTLLFSSPGIPGTSVCQMQSSSYWLGTSCDCPEGKYDLAGAFGCTGCNGNCKTCTGVGTGDCTSCPVGSSFSGSTCFDCDSSCLQCSATGATNCARCASNKFLYWNGTCLGSCVAPLKTSDEGEYHNCSLPCGSDYYFENNTCGTSCPIANNFNQVSYGELKLCNFKCPGGSDYLYSNGSCIASCPYPFVEFIEGVERYCNFPCEGASNYLYENGSCETGCEYPYVEIIEGVAKYCNFSCKTGEYLYENGSCYTGCEEPFDKVTENTIENYCNFKCEDSKYLYENGSCYSGCDSPQFIEILQGTEKYCNFACDSGEYFYQNGSCYTECEDPFDIVTNGVESYCNFKCEGGFYLYENGSCYAGCDDPPFFEILKGVEKYCNFTCDSGEYLYGNGSCYSDCQDPFDIFTNGVETYCNFKCENSEYLYANRSCYAGCDSPPFFEILQGVEKYCRFSCEDSAKYLYENSSCYSGCPDPFNVVTQGLENYCNFPCESSEYLYQNGSCYSDCDSPFVKIFQGTEKYCNFTCPDSAKYLYENGSCYSACPSPLKKITQGSANYCDFPCSSSEYLYPNGSCYSTCPSPFNNITKGTEHYCNFPCKASEFYLSNTGECISSCPSPSGFFSQGIEKYCDLPCPTNEYYFIDNGKCVSTCKAPLEITKLNRVQACKSVPAEPTKTSFGGALQSVFTGSAIIGGLLRPNNLNSAFMVALAKLLKYVQYLDIDFPQDIRDGLTQNSSAGGFCITQMFSYEMPGSLKDQLPQHSLPYYIEKSGVHSSYLVNHWSTMSSYVFLLLLGFAFGIFEKIVVKKKWNGFSLVVTRLRVILKWNFLLFAFFNTFDDLTFFLILELRTLHLNSFMSVLSFIVCLLVSSIAIFVFYKAWKVSRESIKREKQVVDMENSNNPSMIFYKKWENFQVLYAGLKGDSKIKQYYLVIYTSRIIYYFTIAGVFYAYPMVQTIQYLLWSLVMMYILLRKRPIIDRFGYIVGLTYETLVFIVNVCLVILVGTSQTNHLSESTQYTLSKTVLVCNSLVYFFSSLFSWIYILTGIISAYKTSKKKKGMAAKTAWLTVPVSPYSNPGMDFDDLTYETEESLADKELIITLSYPKRTRISRKLTNKIAPIDSATATTEAKSSMKSLLSLHWNSKNDILQRETPTTTSDLFSRRSFAFGQQPNESSLQSFAKVKLISQNGYQSNLDYDSVNLDNVSPKKPDPRLRTKPKNEKAPCLSIDELMMNDGNDNDEDKLKFGLSEFFSDENISRVNSPLNSAKNQSKELIKIQGLENNNIAGGSSDENSIRNIQENSPKSLLFNHNLQLPRRERGSLYATFLSSQFSVMAHQKRQSMFSKDTSFARNNNFQDTVDNSENGSGSGGSLSFNFNMNQDLVVKIQRRKRPLKEDSNISLSTLRTGSGSNSQN